MDSVDKDQNSTRATARYQRPTEAAGNKFGTFGGVFTPSILTILGVIMFMRSGFVVGQAGILGSIGILIIAKGITVLTAFSVSAISTNMQVRGGGAYFMISRVLGAEFGGAIGLALFFAQALSVPFYILGFAEALTSTFKELEPHFLGITLATAALLYLVAFVGAGWAIRAQFLIMAVLAASIVVMFAGIAYRFSPETFATNWASGYGPIDPTATNAGRYGFWTVFAIYFPAVTGILAGVNMSGDLENPAKSIPAGTLYALGLSFVIYLLLSLGCGGAFDRAELIARPYRVLKDGAIFGLGWLIAAGVFAASLSSALGSYLGAPRILQAVSRDGILSQLRPFAKGAGEGDEPRRALALTGLITLAVLLWAGNEAGGAALNAVASIITMFFLYTYGMTNLAAFIEALGKNPSFRPRFSWFHWSTALVGGLGCIGVAILIDPIAAAIAIAIIALLLWYITTRQLESAFGDARRGFVYSSVRRNLLRLAAMDMDSKNWRPTLLVFSGNPHSRETLVTYAIWLESGRGIVILANVLKGVVEEDLETRNAAEQQLITFCKEGSIQAFPLIALAADVGVGLSTVLQSATIGPLRPNIAMWGWSTEAKNFKRLAGQLRIAKTLGMSLLLVRDRGLPQGGSKRIDVWWRGRRNGGFMVILAHLLSRNWEWSRTTIRVLRVVSNETERQEAVEELSALIEVARIDAVAVACIDEGQGFAKTLYSFSKDADCVLLGFEVPPEGSEQDTHKRYTSLLKGLPTSILVHSCGTADMLA